MITSGNIIFACWIVFLCYWFISSWFVKKAEKVAWSMGWFRIIIIALVLVLVFSKNLKLFTDASFFPYSWFLQAISVLIVVAGLVIAIIARITLSSNWSGNVEIKKNHELITKGIYKYVRHPIYTGLILMGLGTTLSIATISVSIIFFICLFFIEFKIKKEESLLSKHFPKDYPVYKKHTKALIPYII